jgi:hypothetical protein
VDSIRAQVQSSTMKLRTPRIKYRISFLGSALLLVLSACGAGNLPLQGVALGSSATETQPPTATPAPTDTPSPTLTSTITPTSTITATLPASYAWEIYFLQDFPPYFWNPGQHTLRLVVDCPSMERMQDFEATSTFDVDENTPIVDPKAGYELVFNGVLLANERYQPHDSTINPQLKSTISVGYKNLTYELAQQAHDQCKAWAVIDNDKQVDLKATIPYPYGFLYYPYVPVP